MKKYLAAFCAASVMMMMQGMTVYADETTTVTTNPSQTETTALTVVPLNVTTDGTGTTVESGTASTTSTTETTTVTTTTIMTTTPAPLSRITYTLEENGAVIENFKWTNETVVEIPAEIEGKPVTKIAPLAFQYCYADSVILPATVEEIGDSAFAGCRYLKTMEIPQNCRKIGDNAFADCKQLASVTVPAGVSEIGIGAFDGTPFIQSIGGEYVILGSGILYAYNGSAADLILPDTITCIGANVFANHGELRSVVIPQSVRKIYTGAFDNCLSLANITAEGTPEMVAPDAVSNTKWFLESKEKFLTLGGILLAYNSEEPVAEIPAGVTVIGASAFEGNPYVTTVKCPDGVQKIKASAFYRCTSLQLVMLPDSVVAIGDNAFFGCNTLAYIQVGKGLVSIGEHAFVSCDALKELHLPDTLMQLGTESVGWKYDAESDTYALSDSIKIYANAAIAAVYAERNGIPCEPLPQEENTVPTIIVSTAEHPTGFVATLFSKKYRAGVIAGGIGLMMVLFGGVAVLIRKRESAK